MGLHLYPCFHISQVASPNSGKEVRAQRKVSPTEVKKQTSRISEISPKGSRETYRNFSSSDATEYTSSHLLDDESLPTAASEKELVGFPFSSYYLQWTVRNMLCWSKALEINIFFPFYFLSRETNTSSRETFLRQLNATPEVLRCHQVQ